MDLITDHSLHIANLFDRDMVKFLTCVYSIRLSNAPNVRKMLTMKLQDMVTSPYIFWPEC